MESAEVADKNAQIAAKLGEFLNAQEMSVGSAINVLLFVMGDVLARATQNKFSQDLIDSVKRDLEMSYRLQCPDTTIETSAIVMN